jgi:hypothetical protein
MEEQGHVGSGHDSMTGKGGGRDGRLEVRVRREERRGGRRIVGVLEEVQQMGRTEEDLN